MVCFFGLKLSVRLPPMWTTSTCVSPLVSSMRRVISLAVIPLREAICAYFLYVDCTLICATIAMMRAGTTSSR